MMRRAIISIMTAVLTGVVPATGSAQTAGVAATATETAAAGQFISNLADKVFAVLKENLSKGATKAKFRGLLKDNFAVDTAGAKLIRRYRNQITPAQLAAYQSALPDYVVNVYADRLIAYGDASVKVVRTQAHGPNGNVDVFSHIVVPGKKELDIIWLVEKGAGGKWLIDNVTVSGVNMSLTQEADFSAFIAKNGFDALVTMMKSSNARTA